MDTVRISVIVPVYQAALYLDDCIRSLLAQTLPDFELILVDDGSTDNSMALCNAWAARDHRLRVIHQENAGVSAARNTGIRAARGQWLAFVDSDDWVEPTYLQKMYENCTGVQISLCDVADGEARTLTKERFTREEMALRPSRYAQLPYINYAINKLYARDLLLPDGPRFDPGRKRGEDASFVTACLLRCHAVAVCPEKLYHYRVNPVSATHRFYPGVCRDESLLYEEQNALFNERKMTEEEQAAFARWQYGKVISVLRYIVRYAPDGKASAAHIRQFFSCPAIYRRFTNLPPGIGGRSLLYATLAKGKWMNLLGITLRLLG